MELESPVDISGCIGWLETDSDGNAFNQLKTLHGKAGQWVVFPIDEKRGIVLYYDRDLTDEEYERLAAWLEKQSVPTDDVTLQDSELAASMGE